MSLAQRVAGCRDRSWNFILLGVAVCWLCSSTSADGAASAISSAEELRQRLGRQPAAGSVARLLLQRQPRIQAVTSAAAAPVALVQTGNILTAALIAKSAVHQHIARNAEEEEEDKIITPLPNDTISEEYWIMVNEAIAEAGRHTPRPTSLNDRPPQPTKEPWQKVFEAATEATVVDTPETADNALNNWELNTPMPYTAGALSHGSLTSSLDATKRHVGVVPYDMQIGARIMYSLSEHQTSTPPPTQLEVDEEFTAMCPMILVNGRLRILGPRCGIDQGVWTDPVTGRVILRWTPNSNGGLRFGVDSLVRGNGSVTFANFNEAFSVTGYYFKLYNCMGVERYIVQEDIVKVDHMASDAVSTVYDHDMVNSKQAIFYKYTVKRPDGTPVAATALFRLGQSEVNITRYGTDAFARSSLIASAKRNGVWYKDDWKKCTQTQRGWNLEFPASSDLDTVATVQDLRIVAAAIVNMMAYRDEEVGADGLQHSGQAALYWHVFKWFLLIFFISVAFCVCSVFVRRRSIDKKLRRLLFRIEQVALPKRVGKVRQPVLHPTY